jgi:ATP-dependent Clp protease ATP-binding subunit ClpX
LIRQYETLFEMEHVKLKFEEAVLDFIVEKAIEYKLGARGLRSICEAIMLDLMFDTPGTAKDETITVSLTYAKEKIARSNISKLKVA